MSLLLAALAVFVVGGSIALLLSNRPHAATWVGRASAVAGCAIGLIPASRGLFGGATPGIRWPGHVPYGEFHLAIDPLSAVFLLAIFGLSLLAAIYGAPYLKVYSRHKSLGPPWFFFNLLVGSMAVLVVARNGIL